MRGKSHKIEVNRNSFPECIRRQAAKASVKGEEFRRCKPLIEPEIFRKETNLPPNFNASRGNAQDERFASARLHKPEEHFDRSAFAGAVGAQESKDFAAAHG